MPFKLLAILCAALMLLPAEAGAAPMQMGLGLGYVRGECGIANAAGESTCFNGARTEIQVNWLIHNPLHKKHHHKDGDDPDDQDDSGDDSGSSASHLRGDAHAPNMNFGHFGNGGGGVGALIAIGVILAVIVLGFGLYWAVLGLLASRIKMGTYYSYDFQQAQWGSTGDLSRYQVHRLGIQAGFYFFPRFDLEFHVGAGPALATLQTSRPAGKDSSVLRGVSSKVGLGYVPASGNGFFAVYEFEGTFFNKESLAGYVEKNVTTQLPSVRHSGAGLVGWTFAL